MSTLYTNNFDGFADGTVPAGWTGYWSIYNWAAEAISGTGILVALGQSPGAFGKYSGMAARTVADYTYRQKAKFNGASLPIHPIIHSDGEDVWANTFAYRVIFTASAAGVTASMAPFIDGGFPGGPSATHNVAFSTGDEIAVRLRVDGKNVSCWVWNASTESMPVDPLVTWTDSTQRAAGYFAIALNNESAIANPIDNVVITDGAAGGGGTSLPAAAAGAAVASGTANASLSSPAAGTITISDIRDLTTGALRPNESGITVIFNHPTTGALVVLKAGQTTNAGADLVVSDPALVAGTTYRVTTILADGSEGTWKYTAS